MVLPFIPDSFSESFPLALLALVCWGSWSNTAKAAAHIPFAYYVFDFSLAISLTGTVLFLSLGGQQMLSLPLPNALRWERVVAAAGAGLIFNVANILLTLAVQLAGLSLAFPVGIGTALVLGTVLTFLIDQKGDPTLLFPGVALALVAVLLNAAAHVLKDRRTAMTEAGSTLAPDQERKPLLGPDGAAPAPVAAPLSHRGKLVLCVVSGVLMSLWSPLSAYSMAEADALTPYASFLLFAVAQPVSTPVYLAMQRRGLLIPRVGAYPTVRGYLHLPLPDHGWGMLGGLVWSIGTLSNLVSGDTIGLALSYAIGQSAPMVATLWGLLYYREFTGAPWEALVLLLLMFLFYAGAVAVIALGG